MLNAENENEKKIRCENSHQGTKGTPWDYYKKNWEPHNLPAPFYSFIEKNFLPHLQIE